MANVVSTSTIYIDATGTPTTNKVVIKAVVLTATAASAVIALLDASNDNPKITLKLATDAQSQVFDFAAFPLVFPNGVKVGTLTNAVATLIYNSN